MLEDTQSRMSRYALNKKVLLELAVIRMCDLKLDDSSKALLARVAELEKRPVIAAATADTEIPAEEHIPVAVPEEKPVFEKAPAAETVLPVKETEEEFECFAEFLEALSARSDIASFAAKADIRVKGNVLRIYTDFIGYTMLSKADATAVLKDAVIASTGKQMKIEIKQNNTVRDEMQTSLLDSLGE